MFPRRLIKRGNDTFDIWKRMSGLVPPTLTPADIFSAKLKNEFKKITSEFAKGNGRFEKREWSSKEVVTTCRKGAISRSLYSSHFKRKTKNFLPSQQESHAMEFNSEWKKWPRKKFQVKFGLNAIARHQINSASRRIEKTKKNNILSNLNSSKSIFPYFSSQSVLTFVLLGANESCSTCR